MHLKFWIMMTTLFGPLSLQALLPPLYLSLAEFKAIIDDKRLVEKLSSGEEIVSMKRIDENSFEIRTTKHKIAINVVFEKTEMIGPGKFHLEFLEPQPLRHPLY